MVAGSMVALSERYLHLATAPLRARDVKSRLLREAALERAAQIVLKGIPPESRSEAPTVSLLLTGGGR